MKKVNPRFSGIIGNILEHYDNALFSLLAPFIAPLFFYEQDPLTALILTYGMLCVGILGRPLGALFFGWIGDYIGRRHALFLSLIGMACSTVCIGFLPVYSQVGILAPLLLALARLSQSFFAAGETVGGAIFVLEQTQINQKSFMSSLYSASSILGVLLASVLVTWFSYLEIIEKAWRLLFWMGGVTGIVGFLIRDRKEEKKVPVESSLSRIKKEKKFLFFLIFVSGFSYTTYALPFVLMNSYVPLVTLVSKTDVMKVNSLLLIVDFLLLPCFGFLANRVGKEKVMLFGSICSALTAIPLFYLLSPSSTFATIVWIRFAIVFFGVAFAAPYHAWAIEQVPSTSRYTILSLGNTLGSQLIGAPASAICLFLYQQTGWIAAPGVYLLILGLMASYVLFRQAALQLKTAR